MSTEPDNQVGSDTCFYWPHWHGQGDDGTLYVKVTGYEENSHWTGEVEFTPGDPDFEFWTWLIQQKQHHHPIESRKVTERRMEWESTRDQSAQSDR